MSWINKHRKIFRVIILALLVVAIMGPWLFDVIYVPAEYECHAPYIRLKEDLCGIPLSGIRFLLWMVPGFVYTAEHWLRGQYLFPIGAASSFLLFLILLPFFSTLLLILRERRSLQIFNVVAWGLALGLCLLIWVNELPESFLGIMGFVAVQCSRSCCIGIGDPANTGWKEHFCVI